MMPDADEDNFLPPLTPYGIMKLGRVKLLPFFMPGDPAMGAAVRSLAGKRSAVMLANHGPVVAGRQADRPSRGRSTGRSGIADDARGQCGPL